MLTASSAVTNLKIGVVYAYWLCVCLHVYVYMYMYILNTNTLRVTHTRTHTDTHANTRMYMQVYIYTYISEQDGKRSAPIVFSYFSKMKSAQETASKLRAGMQIAIRQLDIDICDGTEHSLEQDTFSRTFISSDVLLTTRRHRRPAPFIFTSTRLSAG